MKTPYDNLYKTKEADSANGRIEQLLQLLRITWDGDLVSKHHRDELVKSNLAQRMPGGFNLINEKGIIYLADLGFIHP